MSMLHERCLNLLGDYFSKQNLTDFRLARQEFHRQTGTFEENEPWFELRMTMFMDWYLLEREFSPAQTPLSLYLAKQGHLHPPEEQAVLLELQRSFRSVFQVTQKKGDQLLLKDLIAGGLWPVRWIAPVAGLEMDDIFNTRIILENGSLLAGRAAVLHPVDAHQAIEQIISHGLAHRAKRTQIVDYLDKVKLKLDRYANVRIKHVYRVASDEVF